MPSPWNAALLIDNVADRSTVTASSSMPLTPPALLLNHHIARKTRFGAVVDQYVVADLGSAQVLDTACLFGLNFSAAGVARVRASLSDSSGIAGEVYDSGALVGKVDPAYASLVHLAPAPFTARYIRIDLSDASLSVLEAGRLVLGERIQMAINFSYGWSRSWVDRSRRTESRGGQMYVDADNGYRTAEVVFEKLLASERYGIIEDLDRVIGTRGDFLLILKPDSPNLGRDTIWGFTDQVTAVTQPNSEMDADGQPIFSKPIRIRERL